jgi:hypothetical protein
MSLNWKLPYLVNKSSSVYFRESPDNVVQLLVLLRMLNRTLVDTYQFKIVRDSLDGEHRPNPDYFSFMFGSDAQTSFISALKSLEAMGMVEFHQSYYLQLTPFGRSEEVRWDIDSRRTPQVQYLDAACVILFVALCSGKNAKLNENLLMQMTRCERCAIACAEPARARLNATDWNFMRNAIGTLAKSHAHHKLWRKAATLYSTAIGDRRDSWTLLTERAWVFGCGIHYWRQAYFDISDAVKNCLPEDEETRRSKCCEVYDWIENYCQHGPKDELGARGAQKVVAKEMGADGTPGSRTQSSLA